MTKTGHIGFLAPGSKIECRHKGNKISITVRNIIIDPDDSSVLVYVDHTVGKTVKENICVGVRDLHNWFNQAKWKAVKVIG